MARGDPWRLMGGLYIPNPRFLLDTDFDPTDTDWLPDGWEFGTRDGNVAVRSGSGFSDHRGLRLTVGSSTGVATQLFSPRTPPGSIPMFETTGVSLRLRFLSYHKKSANTANPTISIIVYNATESSSLNVGVIKTYNSVNTAWTKTESELSADLSFQTTGVRWDHARILLTVPTSSSSCIFNLDDLAVGYRLTNPADPSQAYDTITARPEIGGLALSNLANGRYDRGITGQLRYVDPSSGNAFAVLPTRWEVAREADRKVFEHAIALNRGLLPIGFPMGNGPVAAPPAAGPIVVEPFMLAQDAISGAGNPTWGHIPDYFYAYITNEPRFEPLGFLSNVLRGDLTFEEVG